MSEETSKLHGYFFVLLFVALLVGSYFWAKQVRAAYQDPGIEVENKVPDPFRPDGTGRSESVILRYSE